MRDHKKMSSGDWVSIFDRKDRVVSLEDSLLYTGITKDTTGRRLRAGKISEIRVILIAFCAITFATERLEILKDSFPTPRSRDDVIDIEWHLLGGDPTELTSATSCFEHSKSEIVRNRIIIKKPVMPNAYSTFSDKGLQPLLTKHANVCLLLQGQSRNGQRNKFGHPLR